MKYYYYFYRDAKQLFTGIDAMKPEIDLHQVIDEIGKKQGARWTTKAREEGEWIPIQHRLEKKEIQEVGLESR